MPNTSLHDFPTEDNHGPWPLLKPTQEDLYYMPTSQPSQAPQPQRPQQAQQLQQLQTSSRFLDFARAALKGVIVGLFAFGLTYSFLPLQTFWLPDWHWAYLVGSVALLILLIGIDITFIIVLVASILASLWFNWRFIITYPLIPLLFIGGGIIIFWVRELLPRKTP